MRLIVPLDESCAVQLDARCAYDWRGQIWSIEIPGCALCADLPEPSTLICTTENGTELFWCLNHKELEEIPYRHLHHYTIQLGELERVGSHCIHDELLLPTDLGEDERNQIVSGLLDEFLAEVTNSEDS